MRLRFRVAATAALVVAAGGLTAAAAPHAAPAQAGPCCIVRGERWFTGPTQAADCAAAREILVEMWDFVTPCNRVGDRTHVGYNRIIS